ncbi:hypothetical protein GCM10010112_76840 [Actinoplanes lobatus]|nr:hypothetical protein GCM10010112_76840 [Actinoplanes lobatus]
MVAYLPYIGGGRARGNLRVRPPPLRQLDRVHPPVPKPDRVHPPAGRVAVFGRRAWRDRG